ncbi:MAG: hypothetical protein ACK5KT_11535 [Dysgonomonas sp.]
MKPCLSGNRLLPLFALLLTAFFLSCEFDNDDNNFNHIVPPPDEIPMGIDLAGLKEGETIYIYTKTYLTYSLNTSGKSLLSKEFYLDDVNIPTDKDPNVNGVYIDPGTIYADEDHTLTLKIAIKSGSGSLADALNIEGYLGEIKFKVKYVKADMKLDVKQRQNTNKNLELYWEKPQLEQHQVKGYTIYQGDNENNASEEKIVAEINDPNTTSFVDPTYVYGYRNYHIKVHFEGDKIAPWNEYVRASYKPIEKLITSRPEASKLKIGFNNENTYPCKYVVKYYSGDSDDTPYPVAGEQAYIIKENTQFPVRTGVKSLFLFVLPSDASDENYLQYPHILIEYSDPHMDEYIISHAVDKNANLYYTLSYDKLNVYNMNTMQLAKRVNHNISTHDGSVVAANTSGRIAITETYGKAHIFGNNTLANPLYTFETTGDYTLTNDNKVIYNRASGIYMGNINNGNITTLKTTSQLEGFVASQDGKYIVMPTNTISDFGIFDITSGSPVFVSDLNPEGHVVYINNNRMIVNRGLDGSKEFTIYELPSMTVLKKIAGTFKDIDAYGGNILYVDPNYSDNKMIYVLSSDYSKNIFEMQLNTDHAYIYLTNNFLFVDRYYINLSKMIQK